jgi:hypothetical protein
VVLKSETNGECNRWDAEEAEEAGDRLNFGD